MIARLANYGAQLFHRICMYYPIALKFRGSKFLRMAVFDDFVEIISRFRCLNHAHVAT